MRKEVLDEGSLREIAQLILEPLVRHKPRKAGLTWWLEAMFNTPYRKIDQYTVIQDFKMPGRYKIAAEVSVEGLGYRDMKVGNQMWIRTDSRAIDLVEIEAAVGVGRASHCYDLDAIEYARIGAFIKKGNGTR